MYLAFGLYGVDGRIAYRSSAEKQRQPYDEFGDLIKGGTWYCVQCDAWHKRNHGHYANPLCHRMQYGQKPILKKPKGAITK